MVPTRGDHERLRFALACLAVQTGAPPHEVVVVDDNDSGDDARALASVLEEARRLLPVRGVAGPGRGRAAARNTGAAAADAPWVVFLDADVVVGPGFLRAYADAVRPSRFLHGRLRELPSAARLLARLRGAPLSAAQEAGAALHTAPAAGAGRDPLRRTMANALERAIESMAAGTLPDVAPWLGLVGANSAVSKDTWLRTGGFDEGFDRVWGCEDLEFGLRLHDAGLRRHLVPEAHGIHLSHARPDRWEQHSLNMDRFSALHPRASVRALAALLGPSGTPERYVAAVGAADPVSGSAGTP
ncbi:glycosyltransferase [Streptomyces sp. H27-C3]|uniref:glycosyltransferase family 2 protein n=1 Tax=Streptomyces sp. H27-C3 TaxID=3046305 RepID=UPI0024BB5041|nr:glycosyltransferase [Streptomyces sp. H27-C3]MDJ0462512.1 glycosyltransferase [Streptomyces sp. H27-C3]